MKNKKILIISAAITLIGVGLILFKKKKTQSNAVSYDEPEQVPVLNQQSNLLDGNKVLKFGVNGIETKELQRILGFKLSDQDGKFGNQTETALINKKGVKQITLNQWITTPNTNNPNIDYKFKVGDTLKVNTVSNLISFPIYKKIQFTNTYTPANDKLTFQNNQQIGKVVELRKSLSNKPLYLIENTIFSTNEYYLASENYLKK